jgi:hypothetical protein
MTDLSKMTISEGLKYLRPIATAYGLKLNRVKDFRLAKRLMIMRYLTETV